MQYIVQVSELGNVIVLSATLQWLLIAFWL